MNIQELKNQVSAGQAFKYLYFWGHQPQPDGGVGKGCLSQWWPLQFEVEGVQYASAEHYMMAEKARQFGDGAALERILACDTPAEAKKIGREVHGFVAETWNAHRFEAVVRGNMGKFQHADLQAFLLSTGEQVLVEASPRDRIWGIGMGAANEKAGDPHTWRGLNLLGFALMEVRQALRGRPGQELGAEA